jgi:hypothetical protein
MSPLSPDFAEFRRFRRRGFASPKAPRISPRTLRRSVPDFMRSDQNAAVCTPRTRHRGTFVSRRTLPHQIHAANTFPDKAVPQTDLRVHPTRQGRRRNCSSAALHMRATTLQKASDHEEGIWALAWVPDTDSLLTGSVDETVKLWRMGPEAECKVLQTYTGQTLGVIAVTAEPTGPYAASSSLDSAIRVWNITTHQTRTIIETPPSETWGIQFGPVTEHSVTIAAAGGSTGRVAIHKAESSEDPASTVTMDMPQVLHACAVLNYARKDPSQKIHPSSMLKLACLSSLRFIIVHAPQCPDTTSAGMQCSRRQQAAQGPICAQCGIQPRWHTACGWRYGWLGGSF